MDIGCCMGDFAAYCIDHGANHVTGIGISLNMITAAINRLTHGHLTFLNTDFEDLNIQNNLIYFIGSLWGFAKETGGINW
ncbi:MAG: class I SAM-dependent methyltransferase [Anaerorhabdus sp.]